MQPNSDQHNQIHSKTTAESSLSSTVTQITDNTQPLPREIHPLAFIGGLFFVQVGLYFLAIGLVGIFFWQIATSAKPSFPMGLLSVFGLGVVVLILAIFLLTSKRLTIVSKQTVKQRQFTGLAMLAVSATVGLYAVYREMGQSDMVWFAIVLLAIACGTYGIVLATGSRKILSRLGLFRRLT